MQEFIEWTRGYRLYLICVAAIGGYLFLTNLAYLYNGKGTTKEKNSYVMLMVTGAAMDGFGLYFFLKL